MWIYWRENCNIKIISYFKECVLYINCSVHAKFYEIYNLVLLGVHLKILAQYNKNLNFKADNHVTVSNFKFQEKMHQNMKLKINTNQCLMCAQTVKIAGCLTLYM